MQAIFMGKTDASCPSRNDPAYAEAAHLGFPMLPSKSNTYQSTQTTMRPLVDEIISRYFNSTKKDLDLLPTQYSVQKNRLSVSSQIGRIPELDDEKPPNDYRHFYTRGNNEYMAAPGHGHSASDETKHEMFSASCYRQWSRRSDGGWGNGDQT
jgi:hypothetical protein